MDAAVKFLQKAPEYVPVIVYIVLCLLLGTGVVVGMKNSNRWGKLAIVFLGILGGLFMWWLWGNVFQVSISFKVR